MLTDLLREDIKTSTEGTFSLPLFLGPTLLMSWLLLFSTLFIPPFSAPISGDEDEDIHVLKLCTIDADVNDEGEITDVVTVELTSRVLLLLIALSSEYEDNDLNNNDNN